MMEKWKLSHNTMVSLAKYNVLVSPSDRTMTRLGLEGLKVIENFEAPPQAESTEIYI